MKVTPGRTKFCRYHMGNNPMVGATVACAVAVEEASKNA
jgi:lipoprotein